MKKHGYSKTTEYKIWSGIKYRSKKTNGKIIVCERWVNSYENFLEDMGRRPSFQHSLDRILNTGAYEPSNCKWSSKKEQARNRKTNRFLTLNGQTECVTYWADKFKIPASAIFKRLKIGWSIEQALTTPSFKLLNKIYVHAQVGPAPGAPALTGLPTTPPIVPALPNLLSNKVKTG